MKDGEDTLHVEIVLKSPSPRPVGSPARKKRTFIEEEEYGKDVVDEGEDEEDISTAVQFQHSGEWSILESILFDEGVKLFGWGNWSRIAKYIKTRDRRQVFKFSLTEAGQRANRIPSVIHAYVDLANGMTLVAEHLENQAPATKRSKFSRSSEDHQEEDEEESED